jgi:hypothetical protein
VELFRLSELFAREARLGVVAERQLADGHGGVGDGITLGILSSVEGATNHSFDQNSQG